MKILIVDDLILNRMLLEEALRSIGHESMQAENGEQAIEILRLNEIDVVFMDIEMPVMNGVETTEYIRTQLQEPRRSVPIIALTAHNIETFQEDFHSEFFTHILNKPYTIEKLIELLKTITNR